MPPIPRNRRLDRLNNFDFLRVLFAIFVIISHSYPLYGIQGPDWLKKQTGTVNFSDLGLGGFFCISGYLVYQSSQRSSTYFNFMWKRVLRIFPALIINTLLVALLLGAIVLGFKGYYSKVFLYTYIVRNITLFNIQYGIGDLFKFNPYPRILNGSLWTIPYEFFFYLLFFIAYLNKTLSRYLSWLLIPLFILLLFLRWRYPNANDFIPYTTLTAKYIVHFALWFTGGIIMAVLSAYWMKYKIPLAVISFIALLTLFTGNSLHFIFVYILWTVFVVSFGNCKSPIISSLDKIGDPSYGIYIYGFIVQQTLAYYFYPEMTFYSFMLASILLSILLGYLSWYGIEKRALAWKGTHSAKESKG